MRFRGAEVMTGRRSTIRQARLWARMLARIMLGIVGRSHDVLGIALDEPRAQPDDVALHMGAPPRWRGLFGRTVLRCYRAELTRLARAAEQAA